MKTLMDKIADFGKNVKKKALIGGLVGITALSSLPKANAATDFSYSPDQIGGVSAPILGLGSTSNDYLLTNNGGWSTLDKDFDGNNQEDFAYPNTSSSKDGASFDDNHMLQLSESNDLFRISFDDGTRSGFNGHMGVHLGQNVFGIGYEASLNKVD